MLLIDADALIRNWCGEHCGCEPSECGLTLERDGCEHCETVTFATEQPTVDAVPVVRCGECRYYLNSSEKCALIDTRLGFYERDNIWTEDSFCSWGKRREDGDDRGL